MSDSTDKSSIRCSRTFDYTSIADFVVSLTQYIAFASIAMTVESFRVEAVESHRFPLPSTRLVETSPRICSIGFPPHLIVNHHQQVLENFAGLIGIYESILVNHEQIELLDSFPSGNTTFYRITGGPTALPTFPPLASFCAIGDSITDRATFAQPAGYDGLGYDQSGWASILEQYSGRRLQSTARSNAFKADRDHGYSGITSSMYLAGGGWLPTGLIPIDDAIASNPDCFIVHIGTNDIANSPPAAIVSQIYNIWERLVATGKPVIGTDILNRPASCPGWNTTYRDRVNEVNTALRSTWRLKGLASYRPWDDLIEKDPQGFAVVAEFPNDYVHPTMRVGLKLGKDLHQVLSAAYAGTPPVIPAATASAWLTPNSQVEGKGELAPSWISHSMGVVGTDVIFSKTSDAEGVWQKVSVITPQTAGVRGVYSRQVGARTTWQVGDRCLATIRLRIPDKTRFNGIGILVHCVGAESPWIDVAGAPYTANSPIDGYDAVVVSDPFTIPANTTQLWFFIRVLGGPGTFEFRQAGIFGVSP